MKNKKKRLWMRTIILSLFAIAIAFTLFQSLNKPNDKVEAGDTAPNFVLKNLQGETFHFKKMRGKGVLLNFWGTWCDPCKEEMPLLNELYHNNPVKGVEIVSVNMGESKYVVKQFVDRFDIDFPILLDKNKEVYKAYDVYKIPSTFLINKNGQVVETFVGQMPSKKFIKNLMRIVQPDNV